MLVLLLLKLLVYCICASFALLEKDISVTRYNASYLVPLMQCDLQDAGMPIFQNWTTFRTDEPVWQSKNSSDNVIQLDLSSWRFPSSITVNASGLSERCQRSTEKFLRGIQDHELWALKMLDATAKLPSGILSGNVNQFGNFDECISVQQAQYCLAEIDLKPVWKQSFAPYKNLVHSYFAFRGSFDDPQHRVPDFSSVKWGICIPSDCNPGELENSIQYNFGVHARVRPSMCKRADAFILPLTFGDYFARLFFMVLLLAVTTSSIAVQCKSPFLTSEKKLVRLLLTFSFQNNWQQLTSVFTKEHVTNDSTKKHAEIRAVDGIRALSALALVMCHKSVALMYNPYINRTAMVENFGKPWSVIGRTAIVYTDSFMLISGLLTTHSMLRDIDKHRSLKFKDKLISRIFRITPNILTLILFCTYILPKINSGPLWPAVVEHHADLCKQNMWRNLFYIHNYFGFENMCLTHTHQVGIDMQLFLFTPLLIYFWWFNKKRGLFIAGMLAVLSTILRYSITMHYNLSHMIYPGITVKRMFDTANLSYILPTHRATIYIMGVLLAYLLKTSKFTLNKMQIVLAWIVAISCGILAVFGPFHMANLDYSYNNIHAAIFAAFSPVLWGFCLAWTIFASNIGSAGWFGDFLSWNGFRLFSKIGYAFYLVQFPVFFYNVGVQKTSDEFTLNAVFHFSEMAIIISLSVILTICVEMPFQKVKAILSDSSHYQITETKQRSNPEIQHLPRG